MSSFAILLRPPILSGYQASPFVISSSVELSMSSSQAVSPPKEGTGGNGRFYISDALDKYQYMLPSDEAERERLNVQGQLIIEIFDNKTILAPVALKDGDIILDSGTGSGHWLCAVAKEVPQSIQLRGIDVSSRIFPPHSLKPPNATFMDCSITSLPSDWSNTVSLVHQRLLNGSLQTEQWKDALSEMYRVLVPGGWVQFLEPYWTLVSPSEAIRNNKASALKNKLCQKRLTVIDTIEHLATWMEQAGFVNVKLIEKRGLPLGSWGGETGKLGLKNASEIFRGLKEPVMREGGMGLITSGEEYDAMVDDLARQCEETPGSYYEYWVFIGQKPSN